MPLIRAAFFLSYLVKTLFFIEKTSCSQEIALLLTEYRSISRRNDTRVPPLNIVMKVTECNNGPVAKLSDVEGKNMCKDPAYIHYLKRAIAWRLEHNEM